MKDIELVLINWQEFMADWKARPGSHEYVCDGFFLKPAFFDFMEWMAKKYLPDNETKE